MNKKILIAIIIILAISVAGTATYYLLFARDGALSRGTLVFQSDVAGANVSVLGPAETLRTGVIGGDGELVFTGLPDGNYQAVAVKDGYTSHYVMAASIIRGGRTTVPIYMTPLQWEEHVTVSTDPNAIIIKQGSSRNTVAMVTSTYDYVGVVSLSCSQLPSGVTASFDPASVTLTAGGKASSTLTLMASSTATKGNYWVNIDLLYEDNRSSGVALMLQVS